VSGGERFLRSPFFGTFGNQIDFHDQTDLSKKLDYLDSLEESAEDEDYERHALSIYLRKLPQLQMPFQVRKGESPDILLLDSNGQTIAIEITRALSLDFGRTSAEFDKCPDGSMMEISPFTLKHYHNMGEAKRNRNIDWLINIRKCHLLNKDARQKAIRVPGDRLIGAGWSGDEMERDWCVMILSAIADKIKKLNSPHFKNADSYKLLIVARLFHPKLDEALPMLKQEIRGWFPLGSYNRFFDCISIISSKHLYHDVGNELLVL